MLKLNLNNELDNIVLPKLDALIAVHPKRKPRTAFRIYYKDKPLNISRGVWTRTGDAKNALWNAFGNEIYRMQRDIGGEAGRQKVNTFKKHILDLVEIREVTA